MRGPESFNKPQVEKKVEEEVRLTDLDRTRFIIPHEAPAEVGNVDLDFTTSKPLGEVPRQMLPEELDTLDFTSHAEGKASPIEESYDYSDHRNSKDRMDNKPN